MSRHLRRMLGSAPAPASADSSSEDDECEPQDLHNQRKNVFEELKVSSGESEDEEELSCDNSEIQLSSDNSDVKLHNTSSDTEEVLAISSGESEAEHELPIDSSDNKEVKDKVLNKKKKRKRKPQEKKKAQEKSCDDIDRSIREVNALLGEPSQEAVLPTRNEIDDMFSGILSTRQKYLDYTNELNTMFGPSGSRNSNRRDKNPVNKNNPIVSNNYNFKRSGLSMSVVRQERGLTYFTFSHSSSYQLYHHNFIREILMGGPVESPLAAESMRRMHVEGMLQLFENVCRMEDSDRGFEILERIISYMCHCAHHNFNVSSGNIRLEYRHVENRVFHLVLLRYIYLLSNKACHRTALEIAKVLLNLDPTDPLAVVFVIDVLAIRARAYEWLVDAIDYLHMIRQVKFMFNVLYSYALAHFQKTIQNKEDDFETADELIKEAMIRFPSVVMELLRSISRTPPETIQNCSLFNEYATNTTDTTLQELIHLYAAFIGNWWNTPAVMSWFLRNAEELAATYNENSNIKEQIEVSRRGREVLFRGWPRQVYRHLTCISALSQIIIGGTAIPYIPDIWVAQCFNPAPDDDSINRYMYRAVHLDASHREIGVINDFIASIFPSYSMPELGENSDLREGLRRRPTYIPLDSDDDEDIENIPHGHPDNYLANDYPANSPANYNLNFIADSDYIFAIDSDDLSDAPDDPCDSDDDN